MMSLLMSGSIQNCNVLRVEFEQMMTLFTVIVRAAYILNVVKVSHKVSLRVDKFKYIFLALPLLIRNALGDLNWN